MAGDAVNEVTMSWDEVLKKKAWKHFAETYMEDKIEADLRRDIEVEAQRDELLQAVARTEESEEKK
jgi:hypothetical protein